MDIAEEHLREMCINVKAAEGCKHVDYGIGKNKTVPYLVYKIDDTLYTVTPHAMDGWLRDEPLVSSLAEGEELRELRIGQGYKDFRKVDSSHINKLTSLLECSVGDINVGGQPALFATNALPGGFVIMTGYNKTAAGSVFNRELGINYLKQDIDVSTDEHLWELEGYRIYRIVNTLDSIVLNEPSADISIRLIANGARVVELQDSPYVIVDGTGLPPEILKHIPRPLVVISLVTYIKIVTLVDSYIERDRRLF